jgi:hypothetical protein
VTGIADSQNERTPLLGIGEAKWGEVMGTPGSFLDLEHAGNWLWQVTEADLREIIQFLNEMERLKWTEIFALRL